MAPIILVIVALLIIIPMAVKIVAEHERGVIFRLGRLIGAKGPGLFLIIPFVDRIVKVDLRQVIMDIPSLEAVTRDNVNVQADVTIMFRVVDPEAAVVKVLDHLLATSRVSQAAIRNLFGDSTREQLEYHLNEVNTTLQGNVDKETRTWGVEVVEAEVKKIAFGGVGTYSAGPEREVSSEGTLRANEAIKLRDATEVESLIQALRHKDESTRRHAAGALGKIGDAKAVKPLTQALKDDSFVVQAFAREAIEKIKAKQALQ